MTGDHAYSFRNRLRLVAERGLHEDVDRVRVVFRLPCDCVEGVQERPGGPPEEAHVHSFRGRFRTIHGIVAPAVPEFRGQFSHPPGLSGRHRMCP